MPTIHHFSDQHPGDSATSHPVSQGGRRQFYQLLQERNEHPERSPEIDRRIQEQFTATHAIFVLDMAGFSRSTMKYGVIHFLAMFTLCRDNDRCSHHSSLSGQSNQN